MHLSDNEADARQADRLNRVTEYTRRKLNNTLLNVAALATPEPPATALDWIAAICVGVGVGVTLYLVAAFAAGRGA